MQDRKRHDAQDKFSEITKVILGCCFDVTNTVGAGFVESVYRNTLVIALNDKCLTGEHQALLINYLAVIKCRLACWQISGKENWNTEECIILRIMPLAILQILFHF